MVTLCVIVAVGVELSAWLPQPARRAAATTTAAAPPPFVFTDLEAAADALDTSG